MALVGVPAGIVYRDVRHSALHKLARDEARAPEFVPSVGVANLVAFGCDVENFSGIAEYQIVRLLHRKLRLL